MSAAVHASPAIDLLHVSDASRAPLPAEAPARPEPASGGDRAGDEDAPAPRANTPLGAHAGAGATDARTEPDASEDAGSDARATGGFDALGLPKALLDAVHTLGFSEPTPIQSRSIPALLEGRDVVGIAQTGTGKTAAFGLPMLAATDPRQRAVQGLVLSPTRELAMQSAQAMGQFARDIRGVHVVAVYGGAPYGPQLHALRAGAQVVVGTPGRIIDLMERGALDFSALRMLVLDEADEMLRMGFAEDVDAIVAKIPADRVTALFSATMPASIERVARTHLRDPEKIAVSQESSTVDTIHQTYAVVPFRHRTEALARVLATRQAEAVLIFVRTRQDVEEVALELQSRGIHAAGISGDVAQRDRERLVARLRDGALDVLVATDVAARGLDVERIGLVVNYDVPRDDEAYVHRVGRTGRAGRRGTSLTFFAPNEQFRLRRIERLTGAQMDEVTVPSAEQVLRTRAERVLEDLPTRVERGNLDAIRALIQRFVERTGTDPADAFAALLARTVGDDGSARRDDFVSASFTSARSRGASARRGRFSGRRERFSERRGSGRSGRRYRVEVGRRDGVQPGAIVGAITGEGGLRGADLGKIDIYPTFSLVEISASLSPAAAERIAHARVAGRTLRIRPDEGPASRPHRTHPRD